MSKKRCACDATKLIPKSDDEPQTKKSSREDCRDTATISKCFQSRLGSFFRAVTRYNHYPCENRWRVGLRLTTHVDSTEISVLLSTEHRRSRVSRSPLTRCPAQWRSEGKEDVSDDCHILRRRTAVSWFSRPPRGVWFCNFKAEYAAVLKVFLEFLFFVECFFLSPSPSPSHVSIGAPPAALGGIWGE